VAVVVAPVHRLLGLAQLVVFPVVAVAVVVLGIP
jgi:hypothetical protein